MNMQRIELINNLVRLRGAIVRKIIVYIVTIVASNRLIPSNELKLLIFGINKNAVINTPKTDPVVLMKKIRPAPASPPVFSCLSKAISIGFIADRQINGAPSKTIDPTKLPNKRSIFPSIGNSTG